MPAALSDLFTTFTQKPSKEKATDVLTQLNTVFERAQMDKDIQQIACEDKRIASLQEVQDARQALIGAEEQLTRLQDRMQSLQSGSDRALAEIESLREQYKDHREMCNKNSENHEKDLEMLQRDLPMALSFVTKVTKDCDGGGDPPALIDCSLPDGSFVTTFKENETRVEVASFSSLTEKLVSATLERAAHGKPEEESGTSLLEVQHAKRRLRHSHGDSTMRTAPQLVDGKVARFNLLQKLMVGELPEKYCAPAKAPACEVFTDNMATFVGNVEDLIDELNKRAQSEDEHCSASLASYDDKVKELKRQADDAGVMLANAVAEQTDLTAQRRERRVQMQDVSRRVDRELGECTESLSDLEATIVSTKKLHAEMKKGAGADGLFVGDCVVSDWIRGPCSKKCGEGGLQNFTREVIKAEKDTGGRRRRDGVPPYKCPDTLMTRSCNEKKCPVDGVMSRWEEWSQCSRACGGGTRTRHRTILQEAQYGGLPTAETMQEQLCNQQPCDQDCFLGEWTAWSNCSKVCNGGHQFRIRQVLKPARGEGTCAPERDPERLGQLPCENSTKCSEDKPMTCNTKMDLVLVLDVSGSIGDKGIAPLRTFAKGVVKRTKLGDDNAAVGVVSFATDAVVASELSKEQSEVLTGIEGIKWKKTNTGTSQAMAVARDMLQRYGRDHTQAVVVVVTDGMPTSSYLTSTEVDRLKAVGTRIAWVVVGSGTNRRVIDEWASFPPAENVVHVPSYKVLKEGEKVSALLANLCGSEFEAPGAAPAAMI
eukprot:gnl/TRDRNA2_/TRDRNA2_187797_c0_seq1.p1 gnl/TRDRNA2_/TRDRNA2_187797_c0~~gnl/TRDRNA2_/TRDRNA2_187797_c0_seq1.p1  ORF type:complete len:900 (-),score=215.98 gnl/TRDRNA2_/TRDRNA2_187797_c0_seq1:123-2423(-)